MKGSYDRQIYQTLQFLLLVNPKHNSNREQSFILEAFGHKFIAVSVPYKPTCNSNTLSSVLSDSHRTDKLEPRVPKHLQITHYGIGHPFCQLSAQLRVVLLRLKRLKMLKDNGSHLGHAKASVWFHLVCVFCDHCCSSWSRRWVNGCLIHRTNRAGEIRHDKTAFLRWKFRCWDKQAWSAWAASGASYTFIHDGFLKTT